MRSNPVVVMHQVLADVSLSLLAVHVASGRYPLCFQAAKYPFHRRIPAVSSATHAMAHAVTPQPLAKVAAAILARSSAWCRKKTAQAAEAMGKSRDGLSTKIHATVDALGNLLRLLLTRGKLRNMSKLQL